MRNILFIIFLFYSSICLGQSGKVCIDVIRSDNGKYYAFYSNKTWEEVTYTNAESLKIKLRKSRETTSPTSSYNRSNTTSSNRSTSRSTYRNTRKSTTRTYIRGPRGGCYYINSNGNKTYVDRSMCD